MYINRRGGGNSFLDIENEFIWVKNTFPYFSKTRTHDNNRIVMRNGDTFFPVIGPFAVRVCVPRGSGRDKIFREKFNA